MINKIWNWIKNIFKPEKQDPHLEMYEEVEQTNKKKYVENIRRIRVMAYTLANSTR